MRNIFGLLVMALFFGYVSAAFADQTYVFTQPTYIRYDKGDVLEILVKVPVGTRIRVPDGFMISYLLDRAPDGKVERSSMGFITPLLIESIPGVDPANMKKYNATGGGLFVTSSIIGDMEGVEGDFPALVASQPEDGFLSRYEASGKPKFSYTQHLQKRFGNHLNHAIDPATQPLNERYKWNAIMKELRAVANRTVDTPKSLLMIDHDLAIKESIAFEDHGAIPLNGAWTIAVEATAVRHGFPNVPCAEFVSENVREAYRRAGFKVTDDFNTSRGNQLIWSNTAAVEELSKALDTAGWIPWDTTEYIPETGAILLNGYGETPGHTYLGGGDHGRFIVDNGSPQGRDLRKTEKKTIDMMYQTGAFFLPPGIRPKHW